MNMAKMAETYNHYSDELGRCVDSAQIIDVLGKLEVVLSEMAEMISKGEDTVQGLFTAADAYSLVAAGCRRKAMLYETQAKACVDTAAELAAADLAYDESADAGPRTPGWIRVGDCHWVREGTPEEDEAFRELEERERVRDTKNLHDWE